MVYLRHDLKSYIIFADKQFVGNNSTGVTMLTIIKRQHE